MPKKTTKKTPWYRGKIFLLIVGGLLVVVLAVALAFRFSPWPGALVIRYVFNSNGHKKLEAMRAQLPKYNVTVLANQQYRKNDRDALLDVYIPASAASDHARRPVVIWTHGGAWLSGNKTDDRPYFERLADQGFTVIALNYTLAPKKSYPYAVNQINDAYAYIQANATRFYADTSKIFLAGDSAGSQLSSQLAAIITDGNYAKEVGVHPNLTPSQLAGVVLYCGIYKMEGLVTPDAQLPKIVGWGNDVTVWAYTGTRDRSTPLIRQMSAYYHVTSAFPAAFISGGNGDPLTNAQSVPFAAKLTELGVPVTTEFFPQKHTPSLPHEYQFTFNSDGETSFAQMVSFLASAHTVGQRGQ